MVIPRIFHQIWLGPDAFPEEHRRRQETWLRHHPGWELRFWTEEALPADLRRPEAAEVLRAPRERAEALRLEAVWRFGGVYAETDVECTGSLEPLLAGVDLFAGLEGAVLGAVAGHPVLDRALDELRLPEFYGVPQRAGASPLPAGAQRLDLDGVAVHRTDPGPGREALLQELAALEVEVQQAQREAFELRRRHQQLQGELERLRGGAPVLGRLRRRFAR